MTLALEVEFLTGRCVASQRDARNVVEWPPHPTRLFSALAAAFFECDFGAAERAALEWLEQQRPPAIASPRISFRTPVAFFVPVNDKNDAFIKRGNKVTVFAKIDEGIELRRNRQMRHFPTVIPDIATVVYRWDDVNESEASQHRVALDRLAHNLTYLGHSSSLVRAGVCKTPPEPTWRPSVEGELVDAVLRVPSRGRLLSLQQAYELSLAINRRIDPPEGAFQNYILTDRLSRRTTPVGVFDERMIIFHRKAGPALPLHASLKLTFSVRKALMELSDEPVPETLSGHLANGKLSSQPHVAVLPLPNVGSRYSTGSIMGFAIVMPRSLSDDNRREERRAVLRAAARLQTVQLGSAGVWQVERLTVDSPYKTLQPMRYTRPSKCWTSITPVIFGRFPKTLESSEAKEMVKEHCRMIGLPEPKRVEIVRVCPVLGVPPASHFPTLSTAGKPMGSLFEKGRYRMPKSPHGQAQPRLRAHVLVEFSEPVCGPVLLGAGRYLGMGFCLPVPRLRVVWGEQ